MGAPPRGPQDVPRRQGLLHGLFTGGEFCLVVCLFVVWFDSLMDRVRGQGAMLAVDAALHCPEAPLGGLVAVSGFLMDIEKWATLLKAKHRNIRALQVRYMSYYGE